MIRAYRLASGADGESHVTRGRIASEGLAEVRSIHFKETAPRSTFDWHCAPVPQYVLTLAGVLEFTTRLGQTFTLCPGDVLIALDTTGAGHKWRLVNDQPWQRAYVILEPGTDVHFEPEPPSR